MNWQNLNTWAAGSAPLIYKWGRGFGTLILFTVAMEIGFGLHWSATQAATMQEAVARRQALIAEFERLPTEILLQRQAENADSMSARKGDGKWQAMIAAKLLESDQLNDALAVVRAAPSNMGDKSLYLFSTDLAQRLSELPATPISQSMRQALTVCSEALQADYGYLTNNSKAPTKVMTFFNWQTSEPAFDYTGPSANNPCPELKNMRDSNVASATNQPKRRAS